MTNGSVDRPVRVCVCVCVFVCVSQYMHALSLDGLKPPISTQTHSKYTLCLHFIVYTVTNLSNNGACMNRERVR